MISADKSTGGIEYRENLVRSFLEVTCPSTDDFLKLKETLSRIGIANHKTKTLYQSCHLLHKRGKYYITHFKELFALDGKCAEIDPEDIIRRNNIALALQAWGMLTILSVPVPVNIATRGKFTVIKYADKDLWLLVPKYMIGGEKVKQERT